MKICSKCKEPKELKEFSKDKTKKDSLNIWCKLCRKKQYNDNKEKILKQKKEYYEDNKIRENSRNKKYRAEHKEEISKQRKNYREEHKEEIAKRLKKWNEDNKERSAKQKKKYREEHKEEVSEYQKNYREEHKEEFQKYREDNKEYFKEHYEANKEKYLLLNKIWRKEKYHTDINFKILNNLRSRVMGALKGKNKSKSTLKLLGCSVEFLKKHLEKQFKPGMTWKNHSKTGWHIDHIKPCAKFDLTKESEQQKCFNYKNLQPLWAEENMKKGSYYEN